MEVNYYKKKGMEKRLSRSMAPPWLHLTWEGDWPRDHWELGEALQLGRWG